jgi:cytochrome bd-type quinol oxidase subunit 2
MSSEHPSDEPHQNTTPFKREPVPDLPRKLPTGSSGIEPAVATGFCALMLDGGAWAFTRDKSGDFFPALTPICMVAGGILTAISVVLFGLVWLKHRRTSRSK